MISRTSCAHRQAAANLAAHCSAISRVDVDYDEAADNCLGLRVGPLRYRSICLHDARPLALHAAAKNPNSCFLGRFDHGVCCLANRWQVLLRDHHRAIVKRDQVPSHFVFPSFFQL